MARKKEGMPLTNGTGKPSPEEQLRALSGPGSSLEDEKNGKRSSVEVIRRGYDREKALEIAKRILRENNKDATIGMVREKLNEEGIVAEYSLAVGLFNEARELLRKEAFGLEPEKKKEAQEEKREEALKIIKRAEEEGAIPIFVSKHLKQVLLSYGFSEEQIAKNKPADLIQRLKEKVGYESYEPIVKKSPGLDSKKESKPEKKAEDEKSTPIEEINSENKEEESDIPTEEEVAEQISRNKIKELIKGKADVWIKRSSGAWQKGKVWSMHPSGLLVSVKWSEEKSGVVLGKDVRTSEFLRWQKEGRGEEADKVIEELVKDTDLKKEIKVEGEKEAKEAIEEALNTPEVKEEIEEAAESIGKGITPKKWEKLKETVKRFGPAILNHWKKNWRELGAGATAGMVARTAIRLSFGSSLGLGAVAGAVGGALSGGVRELYTQKRTFDIEGIKERFKGYEKLSHQGKAALLAKAQEAYDKARISGSEDDVKELANIIRKKKIALGEEDIKEGSEKEKVLHLLKIAQGARREVPKTARKEAQKLIDEIQFERGEIDRKKIARAAMRGALFGAVGGTIAGALSHVLFPPSGSEVMERITVDKIEAVSQKVGIAGAVAKESLEKSSQDLTGKFFHVTVEKGDGLTHLARKAIHDYLVEQKALNPDSFKAPSVEQLVHAEDTLVKKVTQELVGKGNNAPLSVGEDITFKGAEIEETLSKSLELTPQKVENIEHILESPEHTLSGQTRSVMTDWDRTFSESNAFHEEAINEAKKAAEKVIETELPPLAEEVEISAGADAVLENTCYDESVEGFAGDTNVSIEETLEQSPTILRSPRSWGGIFSYEELGSEDAFMEKIAESSGWEVDEKLSAIAELREHLKSRGSIPYIENFIDEEKGELLGTVSSERYEVPGKSLLEKEDYIKHVKNMLGEKDSNFAKQITQALEKKPSYRASLERFEGIVKSCEFEGEEFSKVAQENARKFVQRYGEENVGFWAKAGLSEEEIVHRQKLAEAIKKMLGNGVVGGKKISLAEFRVGDFIKFFS